MRISDWGSDVCSSDLILGESCTRFDWRCFGYCLLPDRYHLVVETRQPTLARGMRQLNGRYTQAFNRRHGIGGHVFQGRYRAVMVESPGWLAAVCRDVLRQPVEIGRASCRERVCQYV